MLGQEIEPIHDRQVPVEDNQVGHRPHAVIERVAAVVRLGDGKVEILEDAPRDFADDA
jgi:hypothetical protein